jgi:hypothetical protein
MVESLGEFEFNFAQSGAIVNVTLKVRRALEPGGQSDWTEKINRLLTTFEAAVTHG